MQLDIAHLGEWIGREETAFELLTADLVRRFNATLDLAGTIGPGEPAPRLIHLCLGQPAAREAELGPDGHPARGGFLPPVPLRHRMWAGGAFAFHDDIRIGETVSRTSRIADVVVKEGRAGTLCFVIVEHRIESDGRMAVSERQDIVYRGAASQPPAPPPPAPAGTYRREAHASSTLLFRYSALTFNGHRIHYDHPYATGVERYQGLVVHGPLLATLLLYFAADIAAKTPTNFSFRGQSPIFDGPFTLNAQEADGGLKLWAAAPGGPVGMSAEAAWQA